MLNKRANKIELIRIAEAVALEKSIDKELIITSMESGIQKAAKTRFGLENEIKVEINRESGEINIYRVLNIVENPTNYNTEISLSEAIKKNKVNGQRYYTRFQVNVQNHKSRNGFYGYWGSRCNIRFTY